MPTSFAAVGVPADLVSLLARKGIHEPFPVQALTLPDALEGRDVCGKAPTGSGKTLAFGIPLVARVGKARARRPRALVLVPTRELAAQVANELKPMAGLRGRSVAAFYGGTGYGPQISALNSGCTIAVACPGRLEDLMQSSAVDLSEVEIVVVDEADRMADMGFLPAVRRILDTVRPDRQTLLFSATLDGDIDDLVKRYQHDPARHEVVVPEHEKGRIEHRFWKVSRDERLGVTAALVQRDWPAVVFCRTRHGADRVARQLGTLGVAAAAIHGDRSQSQRERALASFTSGRVQALVATDVAARGIHVDDVACVVHFDPPSDIKDYVHRSGRTGRAGNDGLVVSMVVPEVASAVRSLQRELPGDHEVTTPDVTALTASTATPVVVPVRDEVRTPYEARPGSSRSARRSRVAAAGPPPRGRRSAGAPSADRASAGTPDWSPSPKPTRTGTTTQPDGRRDEWPARRPRKPGAAATEGRAPARPATGRKPGPARGGNAPAPSPGAKGKASATPGARRSGAPKPPRGTGGRSARRPR